MPAKAHEPRTWRGHEPRRVAQPVLGERGEDRDHEDRDRHEQGDAEPQRLEPGEVDPVGMNDERREGHAEPDCGRDHPHRTGAHEERPQVPTTLRIVGP